MKLLAAAAILLATGTGIGDATTVTTTPPKYVEVNDTASGAVFVGISNADSKSGNSVDAFKGIQYATVGTQRFSVAAMEQYSKGATINATEFGAPCFQPPPYDPNAPAMAEECLHLNIYRPSAANTNANANANANDKLLPVAFWIHGGGFTSGASSMPFFDGSRFAQLEEVGGSGSGSVGIWHLAFGIWHLAFGIWHLAFGIWHLAFGICLHIEIDLCICMLKNKAL